MFIRKKPNKSGSISIQIIDKSTGKYRLVKSIGCSSDKAVIDNLYNKAKNYIHKQSGQLELNFQKEIDQEIATIFFNGLDSIKLVGPELIIGKVFDAIGFNQIQDELFRHLVITRLCYPVSKLKTVDYLFKYKGEKISVYSVYRYLDKLYNKQKEIIQQISYKHSIKILKNKISVVFYDVTTLYFEIQHPDEFRKTGFSKDGKHQNPQIVLGLLVSIDGYPLAYEIFEGNKYEGHTMLPIIESFKKTFSIDQLVVVADAGMLSLDNIDDLENKGYQLYTWSKN